REAPSSRRYLVLALDASQSMVRVKAMVRPLGAPAASPLIEPQSNHRARVPQGRSLRAPQRPAAARRQGGAAEPQPLQAPLVRDGRGAASGAAIGAAPQEIRTPRHDQDAYKIRPRP